MIDKEVEVTDWYATSVELPIKSTYDPVAKWQRLTHNIVFCRRGDVWVVFTNEFPALVKTMRTIKDHNHANP